MEKKAILARLEFLETQIHALREDLLCDPEDAVKFPVYYKRPINDLLLAGLKQPGRFFNACHKHMVLTIGQLVTTGRATIAKWPCIGPHTISIISQELYSRFGVKW